MATKCLEIEFKDFATEPLFYSSYQFHKLNKELHNFRDVLKSKVGDYCNILSGYAFSSEDYDVDGVKMVRIGDFDNQELNLDECAFLPEDFQSKFEKFLLRENDILIAMTGATIGKSAFIEKLNEKLLLNQRVGLLRAKNEDVNSRFFSYLVKCPSFRKQVTLASMGKSQSNISPFDILNIKVPKISKQDQDHIVVKIDPIEQKIKDLKNKIKKPQEVINQVFAREFGFDENLYNEFGKGMTAGTQIADDRTLRMFETDFAGLARSEILRFSTRYHNSPTRKLMEILDGIRIIKVKDVVLEVIHRGASPVYSKNGLIPVVKTGHLKNGYIEISQEEFVEEKFYKSSTRSQIRNGDILIASTGKGSLGKIDLVETEEDLVADGHLSIVRIDEKKYNRLFLVYFFRSVLGYFQIERDFTGATNQIELYANEIGNFIVPNLTPLRQQKIVDEIKMELDAQEKIKKHIEAERQKIDAIIEQSISS